MNDRSEGYVVLLPHPKGERRPSAQGPLCDWPAPSQRHARKFLRVDGTWWDPQGGEGRDWLELWTEYEAPTLTEPLSPRSRYPSFVHNIVSRVGPPSLNTDPWIFRPGFVWTICRHNRADKVRAGDIVLFGSSVDGDWVVDTVFVVDKRLNRISEGRLGEIYETCVLATLEPADLRPFLGRPFSSATDPFSFVPCKMARESHAPFPRLSATRLLKSLRKLSDDRMPSKKNAQALVVCKANNGLAIFWRDLIDEVRNQGLICGTSFSHPGLTVEGSSAAWRRTCTSYTR